MKVYNEEPEKDSKQICKIKEKICHALIGSTKYEEALTMLNKLEVINIPIIEYREKALWK